MTPDDLQFDKAEPTGPAAASARCAACGNALMGSYYEVNGKVVCPSCRQRVVSEWDRGSPPLRVLKAVLFGVGGGIVGAGLYYAVLALTGYQLSLLAIVVGFLVGKGVHRGAERRGGVAYQLLAVAITYAAIVSTYVPLVFPEAKAQMGAYSDSVAPDLERVIDSLAAEARARGDTTLPDTATLRRAREGTVVVTALAISIVTAFVVPFSGDLNVIGLLIVGIGLFEAWRLNRKTALKVAGPFKVSSA